MRVLYSFPHRIGAGRICRTAWYQVAGAAGAGIDMIAAVGSVAKPLPEGVDGFETLARGRVRIPYRILGSMRMFAIHDRLVARWLERHHREVDIVHVWPCGGLETLRAANALGLPTLLERPNANTRYAYDVVQREAERLGVALPENHEHTFNPEVLAKEESEYDLAAHLLCPSEFSAWTFRNAGFADAKLARHFYGVDIDVFTPGDEPAEKPFTAMFVGVAAVRKGLHFALEAWLRSSASKHGRFLVVGEIITEYRRILEPMLAHPSVHVVGHSNSVPDLLRSAHVLVLPSIEEGCALVCTEAMASGCVPLVSNACNDLCRMDVNALVHDVGDVETLADQLSIISADRALWRRLREGGLASRDSISWDAAGERLAAVYRDVAAASGTASLTVRPDRAPGPYRFGRSEPVSTAVRSNG